MKKMLAALFALCLMLVPAGSVRAFETENGHLKDFTDDFESYGVTGKYVEKDPDFTSVWSNNVFDGGDALLMDAHIVNLAKIEYENGSSGNKVFHIVNAGVANNTFFYMAPGNDFRVQDFTATFRVKFNANHKGWVGLSLRKEVNAHYTGTANLLLLVKNEENSDKFKGYAHRGLGGSTDWLKEVQDGGLYGDKLALTESAVTISDRSKWVTMRYEVSGRTYKVYVDDTLVIDLTLDLKMFDLFGYVSFNACEADVLLDDFHIQVNDTELPPVIQTPDPGPGPGGGDKDDGKDDGKGDGNGGGCNKGAATAVLAAGLLSVCLIKRR